MKGHLKVGVIQWRLLFYRGNFYKESFFLRRDNSQESKVCIHRPVFVPSLIHHNSIPTHVNSLPNNNKNIQMTVHRNEVFYKVLHVPVAGIKDLCLFLYFNLWAVTEAHSTRSHWKGLQKPEMSNLDRNPLPNLN